MRPRDAEGFREGGDFLVLAAGGNDPAAAAERLNGRDGRGNLWWVGGGNPVVSPERRGDGWDCCGLGVAIRWCRVAQPPAPMKDVKQQVRLPIREGREGALRAVFSGFRGGR